MKLQQSMQDDLISGLPEDPLSQAKYLRLVSAVVPITSAKSGTVCSMLQSLCQSALRVHKHIAQAFVTGLY